MNLLSIIPFLRRSKPSEERTPRYTVRRTYSKLFPGELASYCANEFEPTELADRSPKTVKAYHCAIRALQKHLQRAPELEDINSAGLKAFAEWRLQGVAAGTCYRDLDCLHALGIHAHECGRLAERPRRRFWKKRANKEGGQE